VEFPPLPLPDDDEVEPAPPPVPNLALTKEPKVVTPPEVPAIPLVSLLVVLLPPVPPEPIVIAYVLELKVDDRIKRYAYAPPPPPPPPFLEVDDAPLLPLPPPPPPATHKTNTPQKFAAVGFVHVSLEVYSRITGSVPPPAVAVRSVSVPASFLKYSFPSVLA
jgi:hypothetical protein